MSPIQAKNCYIIELNIYLSLYIYDLYIYELSLVLSPNRIRYKLEPYSVT